MGEGEVKKCPKCGGEMEKGARLTFHGRWPIPEAVTLAKEGDFYGDKIIPFYCRNCWYIELCKTPSAPEAVGSVNMKVWTCPNPRCMFDKELQSGQKCPLCGELAKEFTFGEVDNLLKQKWGFKKSVERAKREEELSSRVKFCPKCGSENINFLVFYRPSIWKCLDCGYEGSLIIEDSELAKEIRKRYRRTSKETG